MDEFKVNARKMDDYSEKIKDYGKLLKETQEGISSIRVNLRHKLSAAEDIGKALRNIEENMETEATVMLGFGSSLGTIAGTYRNSEQRIVDFGTGSISGSQLSDLQREALEYENENAVRIDEWKEFSWVAVNCYGAPAGAKLFKSAADGIVNWGRNILDAAWDNTVIRSLENARASFCELIHIDCGKTEPDGPVAEFLNYINDKSLNHINDKLKENKILSAIMDTFGRPLDLMEFVTEVLVLLSEERSPENLSKLIELSMETLELGDIVPHSSSGSSSQGGKYRIETGY